MLEDILHLLAWRGFAKDIAPAVASCKATWTDERIWFPFLIQQTYGEKQKTRLQILAEHTTLLNGGIKQHIILKKNGPMIYRSEERWLSRLQELWEMAEKENHSNILNVMLNIPDADGKTIFSVACENNCPKIVSYFLKKGVDYNQKTDLGATPSYYAYTSKFGKDAWRRLPFEADYDYPKAKSSWRDDVWYNFHDLQIDGHAIEIIANTHVPPKPKKLKSKLYKQQFGANGKKR